MDSQRLVPFLRSSFSYYYGWSHAASWIPVYLSIIKCMIHISIKKLGTYLICLLRFNYCLWLAVILLKVFSLISSMRDSLIIEAPVCLRFLLLGVNLSSICIEVKQSKSLFWRITSYLFNSFQRSWKRNPFSIQIDVTS